MVWTLVAGSRLSISATYPCASLNTRLQPSGPVPSESGYGQDVTEEEVVENHHARMMFEQLKHMFVKYRIPKMIDGSVVKMRIATRTSRATASGSFLSSLDPLFPTPT